MDNNKITIVAQAFYGNRVGTVIDKKDVDRFILGYMDDSLKVEEKIDRTIKSIPSTDNVIVYNKYLEASERNRKEILFKEKNYVLKPTVVIEEEDFELYSPCFVCRVDDDGELASIEVGDYKKFVNYLTE